MTKLPPVGTLAVLDDHLKGRKEKRRNYLGMSEMGEECDRKLFYSFHDPMKGVDDPRIKRIFMLGDLIEDHVIALLREAGLTIYDRDPEGNQFRANVEGYPISGGMDGVIVGLSESSKAHVLEVKSAKNSRFKEFVKNGVQATEYKYYAQVMLYMLAFNLNDAFVIVYNKDTSELYSERIKFCPFTAEILMNKGKEIVTTGEIPDRAYSSKTFYKCRWCDYAESCWKDAEPPIDISGLKLVKS